MKKVGQHRTLIQENLTSPSWDHIDVFQINAGKSNWMTPIVEYLDNEVLPDDEKEAKRVRRQTSFYVLNNGELFRRGSSTPLLKCLDDDRAKYVLTELHRGICGMHSRARYMATRVLRAGYYWPTLRQDAHSFSQRCLECQKCRPLHTLPMEELHHITSPWPFTMWGMDILGPFPLAKGQF